MATDYTDPGMLPALMKCMVIILPIGNNYEKFRLLSLIAACLLSMANLTTHCSPCSWDMMMSCWIFHPQQRPAFTSLVKELFDMLDSDSTYLKLNY